MRPWHKLKIVDSNDPLVELPSIVHRLIPHPYLSVGAPYENQVDPWKLRSNVVTRLQLAEEFLKLEDSQLSLAIYDAWRPITVQAFMVDYVITQQCKLKGIIKSNDSYSSEFSSVVDEVYKFWAPPSFNPKTPPPHSTGAAVDLTLAYSDGSLLDMGGDIDDIGTISRPDYYAKYLKDENQSLFKTFHSRRKLLSEVMIKAGFAVHPNEWWHFSFGDQLWAWQKNVAEAIYGTCGDDNKSIIEESPISLM